ncbi:hypothetical protein GCM10023198_07800 [Promicromonospora umidemergens]|uniref:Uncharacterized protein n=1 Tax=Promicromonospora umidemergens TaxID=629679 RepID=A0ABP8WPJ2_9MICO
MTKVNALTERARSATIARRWSTGGAAKLAAVVLVLTFMLFSGGSAGCHPDDERPAGTTNVRGLESILSRRVRYTS